MEAEFANGMLIKFKENGPKMIAHAIAGYCHMDKLQSDFLKQFPSSTKVDDLHPEELKMYTMYANMIQCGKSYFMGEVVTARLQLQIIDLYLDLMDEVDRSKNAQQYEKGTVEELADGMSGGGNIMGIICKMCIFLVMTLSLMSNANQGVMVYQYGQPANANVQQSQYNNEVLHPDQTNLDVKNDIMMTTFGTRFLSQNERETFRNDMTNANTQNGNVQPEINKAIKKLSIFAWILSIFAAEPDYVQNVQSQLNIYNHQVAFAHSQVKKVCHNLQPLMGPDYPVSIDELELSTFIIKNYINKSAKQTQDIPVSNALVVSNTDKSTANQFVTLASTAANSMVSATSTTMNSVASAFSYLLYSPSKPPLSVNVDEHFYNNYSYISNGPHRVANLQNYLNAICNADAPQFTLNTTSWDLSLKNAPKSALHFKNLLNNIVNNYNNRNSTFYSLNKQDPVANLREDDKTRLDRVLSLREKAESALKMMLHYDKITTAFATEITDMSYIINNVKQSNRDIASIANHTINNQFPMSQVLSDLDQHRIQELDNMDYRKSKNDAEQTSKPFVKIIRYVSHFFGYVTDAWIDTAKLGNEKLETFGEVVGNTSKAASHVASNFTKPVSDMLENSTNSVIDRIFNLLVKVVGHLNVIALKLLVTICLMYVAAAFVVQGTGLRSVPIIGQTGRTLTDGGEVLIAKLMGKLFNDGNQIVTPPPNKSLVDTMDYAQQSTPQLTIQDGSTMSTSSSSAMQNSLTITNQSPNAPDNAVMKSAQPRAMTKKMKSTSKPPIGQSKPTLQSALEAAPSTAYLPAPSTETSTEVHIPPNAVVVNNTRKKRGIGNDDALNDAVKRQKVDELTDGETSSSSMDVPTPNGRTNKRNIATAQSTDAAQSSVKPKGRKTKKATVSGGRRRKRRRYSTKRKARRHVQRRTRHRR